MTDRPRRAGGRARSLLRILVGGLLAAAGRILVGGVFAAAGLFAPGCGSSTTTYGTVVTTFSSDPGPFTAYIVDLYGFNLVLGNGNSGYGYSGSLGTGKTI